MNQYCYIGMFIVVVIFIACLMKSNKKESYLQLNRAYPEFPYGTPKYGSESTCGPAGCDYHINYDAQRVLAAYALDGPDTRSPEMKEKDRLFQTVSKDLANTVHIADQKPVVDGAGLLYDHRVQLRNEWFNNLSNVKCDNDGYCKVLTTAEAVPINHIGFASMRDRDIRMQQKVDYGRSYKAVETMRFVNGGILN